MTPPTPSPQDLATLHALCFRGAALWSADAFAEALGDGHFFLHHLPWPVVAAGRADVPPPGGFALGRAISDEAELLTLCVTPALRRRGLGAVLLARFEATARERGARLAFLEVEERNAAARALYARAGWGEAGRRRGYYRDAAAPRLTHDAVVMRKTLA